eukprot:6104946-Pyramimonas_sp.AAC.1
MVQAERRHCGLRRVSQHGDGGPGSLVGGRGSGRGTPRSGRDRPGLGPARPEDCGQARSLWGPGRCVCQYVPAVLGQAQRDQ